MRSAICLTPCALLVTVALLGASEKSSKPTGGKFDASAMVGSWKYVSGEKNGEKVEESHLKGQTITITKDTITLKGEATFVIKYKLDTTKHPVAIKMTMTESPFGAGAMSEGIIEVKGDHLKLCYALPEGEAPKKFETQENSKLHLFVLERGKK